MAVVKTHKRELDGGVGAVVRGSVAMGTGGFAPETQAYFNRLPSLPKAAWQSAADSLIKGLIVDGLWDAFATAPSALWLMQGSDIRQACVNVLNGNFTMTANGTITLTPYLGCASDGTTGYFDTNYPYTAAMQGTLSFGSYIVATSDGNSTIGVAANGTSLCCIPKGANSGTDALLRIATSGQTNWANTVGEAHFAAARNGINVNGFQDGVQKTLASSAIMPPSGGNALWMRRQSAYSKATLGVGWISNLTIVGTDMANLHSRLATFLSAAS
jgi:hypothetical protein